jgi:hypothetical protein
MKNRILRTALGSLALSVILTGSAHAGMIAGWDFSQYFGAGELSVDGASYTNVLSANYSSLDPTFGAGAESSFFGTLYFDGSFGSTNVEPSSGTAALTPTSFSLASNINAPVTKGGPVPFDTYTVLIDEGQIFANELSLQVRSMASFVFAAYTNTIPGLGSDWSVSFGGQTDQGTAAIGIEFSTDGVVYTPFGSQIINNLDTQYSVNLGTLATEAAFVRFTVDPSSGLGARIDNVAINGNIVTVPEPGTLVLLGSALAVFSALGRRRA